LSLLCHASGIFQSKIFSQSFSHFLWHFENGQKSCLKFLYKKENENFILNFKNSNVKVLRFLLKKKREFQSESFFSLKFIRNLQAETKAFLASCAENINF
jgi:hypothetical protein